MDQQGTSRKLEILKEDFVQRVDYAESERVQEVPSLDSSFISQPLENLSLMAMAVDLETRIQYCSGVALARKIHTIRQNIPVILCTGNYDYVDSQKTKEAGIRQFLTKPLFLKNLSETIRAVLERSNCS